MSSEQKRIFIFGDSLGYVSLAETMAESGESSREGDGNTETKRMPGYPLFLYLFQGFDSKKRYGYATFAQLFILHGWIFATALYILRYLGPVPALVFAGILSANLIFAIVAGSIHSDLLFGMFLCSAFFSLLLALFVPDPPRRAFAVAVGSFVLAFTVRPDAALLPYPLLALAAGFALFEYRRPGSLPGKGLRLAIFAASGMIPMLIWSIRNYVVAGRFTYTTFDDKSIYDIQQRIGQPVTSGIDSSTWDVLRVAMENFGSLASQGPVAMFRMFLSPGRWFLHKYSEALAADALIVVVPWNAIDISQLSAVEILYILYNAGLNVVTFALFLAGIVRCVRTPHPFLPVAAMLILLVPIAYRASIAFLLDGGLRAQYPILPILAVFAAIVFARPKAVEVAPARERR